MNQQQMFRQGDVLVMRVDAIPDDATPCHIDGDVILAWGEVTLHAHRLAPAQVKPLAKGGVWSPTAERFLQVMEASVLRHEEHSEIVIPTAERRIERQRGPSAERPNTKGD